MPSRNASSLLPVLLLGVAGVFLLNQHRPTTEHEEAAAPTNQSVFTPKVSGASTEGERALRSFKIPSGFEVSLFAAEPSVINPVTLDVDGRGRVLVVEAYRRAHGGSVDNRHHAYWIDDDLLSETIEDRRALLLKHHPEYPKQWEGISDRVRHLIDDDVDGRADRSLVFADGFDDLLAGTAAGVLRVGDDVFFACIPEIWRLTDSDHDGIAETREAVYTGFGVRIAYRGHDMHGLIQGPEIGRASCRERV